MARRRSRRSPRRARRSARLGAAPSGVNMPLVIGGVALVGLAIYLAMRKKDESSSTNPYKVNMTIMPPTATLVR